MSNKLSTKTVQHLQNAKALIGNKMESWLGREPFPGEAEKRYKGMMSDVNFELHEYETTDGPQPPMSPHLAAVLNEYKGLLEDTILFWTSRDQATATSYEAVLKDLEQLLEVTEVLPGAPVTTPAQRPNVRCMELGRCKIKVVNETMRADTPTQTPNGQWIFDDPEVYRQNRECMTCGRQWTTSVNHGQSGTFEVKAPQRIML